MRRISRDDPSVDPGDALITDIIIEEDRWSSIGLPDLAEQAAVATLRHFGMQDSDFEISILACNDKAIARLNSDFRDKPAATNVLSWPSRERRGEQDGERPELPEACIDSELGDIAISYETTAREATESGKPMSDHVTHLLVHAILHLLGYDHIREGDAGVMEETEVTILGKLGIDNPY